jgi:hypothetical protein
MLIPAFEIPLVFKKPVNANGELATSTLPGQTQHIFSKNNPRQDH